MQINVEKSIHCVTDVGSSDIEAIQVIEPAYLKRSSADSGSPFEDSPISAIHALGSA